MAYPTTGPVSVKLEGGQTATDPWATSVRVDRKGALHIYGHHKQHAVYLEGQWTHYVVSAPTRAEILGDEEDDDEGV